MPPESKTKIRPQQSCLRCRERKVKCDRSIPCHACIIRGLEAECTYLTTAEDRAHISQSEIINQLRREVAQLRGHLNQASPEPSHSQSQTQTQRQRSCPDQGAGPIPTKGPNWTQYAPAHTSYNHYTQIHGNGSGYATGAGAGSASARGTPDTGEGSWRGSSPSSSITTMTNSATVTSPDSTGSENGAGSMSALSRSASASASAYPAATGYAPQVAELDGPTTVEPLAFGNALEDTTMFGCCTGGMAFAPGGMSGTVPVPMQSLPVHGLHAQDAMLGMHHSPFYGANSDDHMLDGGKALPYLQHTGYPAPIPTSTVTHYGEEYSIRNEDDRPHAYHQWGQDAHGNPNPSSNQFPHSHIYQTPSHYSTINPFTNIAATNTDINTYADAPFSLPTPPSVAASPSSQDRPSPTTIMNSMPSSWKGEGKRELLEILLETIGSCDEQHLPQVIRVLRTSPTPEEAVSGVCQVLGIGTG
ncbi:unnamed protein product [Penicillium nalgiovense]|nr:unnamed protein product [Penicillium nalgiovense]